jgi:hypothetical protein
MAMNLSMYAPVEQSILSDYFQLKLPGLDDIDPWEPDPTWLDAIHLEADSDNRRDNERAVANAVARIALARVQTSLPQFAICYPDHVDLARDIHQAPSRPVEALSRHLFTIDWAMTAPGISWPEAYNLTWLPGVERWVVTASRDSPEVGGYCDTTLGHFEAQPDPVEGAGRVIGGYWCDLMTEYDQQHWEVFFEAGMVDRFTAMAWADDVWQTDREEEPDEEGGCRSDESVYGGMTTLTGRVKREEGK